MSEDIYAKPDLTKKIRFQTGVKEDRTPDVSHDIDDERIYDNYCEKEITPPERSQDNTPEDLQQTASVDVSSEKRSVFRAAAVLLGLLCLLLLAAVIILVVLFILERNRLWVENANLNSEKDKLRTSYSEMKGLHHKLTLKTNQLENEVDHLKAANNNLTSEKDELQKLMNETTCCPNKWTRFRNSCYLTSTVKKNWSVSNTLCQIYDAQLVIISSKEEQEFITSFKQSTWIGLTDGEKEGVWKWVDGTVPNETYWKSNQPDNSSNEDCAHISNISNMENWNDIKCNENLYFTCEKVLVRPF